MNSLLTIEGLNMKQTNIMNFFSTTLHSFSYMFHFNSNIQFHYEIEVSNDLNLNFDEDRYRRCIENLISNSLKYTNDGYVKINVYIKDNCLVTVVEDTGKGIPLNEIENILEGKQLQKGTGSGMGLPFVNSYLKLVNGSININSQENIGTSITINIPIENYEMYTSISVHGENNYEKCKCYKMLLVDDCNISRNIVPKLFNNVAKEHNIFLDITTTDNGESGLKRLKENEYDLVFSDYWMPIMDGETMLNKFIKFQPKYKSLLKLYSANVFFETDRKFEVLKKPITKEMISCVIKELESNNKE